MLAEQLDRAIALGVADPLRDGIVLLTLASIAPAPARWGGTAGGERRPAATTVGADNWAACDAV